MRIQLKQQFVQIVLEFFDGFAVISYRFATSPLDEGNHGIVNFVERILLVPGSGTRFGVKPVRTLNSHQLVLEGSHRDFSMI